MILFDSHRFNLVHIIILSILTPLFFTTCKKADNVDPLWVNTWSTNSGGSLIKIKSNSDASYDRSSTGMTIVQPVSNGKGGTPNQYYITTVDHNDGESHKGKARIHNKKLHIGTKKFHINQGPQKDPQTGIISIILDGITYYALSSLPAPLKEGDSYGGGTIFYVHYQFGDRLIDTQHGLIVAPSDQDSATDWTNAVKLCDDLVIGQYNDWYLPSIGELEQLYYNRPANYNFYNGSYWSSSLPAQYQAESIDFSNSYPFHDQTNIGNNYAVRAIRSF